VHQDTVSLHWLSVYLKVSCRVNDGDVSLSFSDDIFGTLKSQISELELVLGKSNIGEVEHLLELER
jgi:hypothetical protein